MNYLEKMYDAWKLREASKNVEFACRWYDGLLTGMTYAYKELTGDEIGFNPLAEDGENPFSIKKKGE